MLVLDQLELAVSPGETVAIIGPNGCGKSTLLEVVCGLLDPDSGEVEAGQVALMPQRGLLMPWATALDNAALGLRAAGAARGEARAQAGEWFSRLGLDGFEGHRPHELSGGMRQRVALARTLMAGRPVIALDEPFAALDAISRIEARGWLADQLKLSDQTVLLVTHDVEDAAVLADRIVVLSPRPATVVGQITPSSRPPRPRSLEEVTETRERIFELLGVQA